MTSRTHGGNWGRDGIAMIGLLLLVAFLWCAAWSKWTATDWANPSHYLELRESDVIGVAAWYRTAANGNLPFMGIKLVPELGAPNQANWSDLPLIEELFYFVPGILSRKIGLFQALNLKILVAHLLAAAAFFIVARYLKIARCWAVLGGIAYGTAPFLFAESPHHPVVIYAWHVPFMVIVWSWLASPQGLPWRSNRMFLAVGFGFVTGLQNVYYTNVFCQIALLIGLITALRTRAWRPLVHAGSVIAASACAFFLMHLDSMVSGFLFGRNPGSVERSYRWLEIYGLKLIDLIVPLPTHQSEWFREWSLAHNAQTVLVNEGGYLGLLGIGALLVLAGYSVIKAVYGRWGEIPAAAWQTLWIFVVFTTGGLNAVAGAVGITWFRAGYRMSIVISAIALMFLMRKLSDWIPAGRPLAPLLAVALGAIVVWDHLPVPRSFDERAAVAAQVTSDREFVQAMEAALPPDAMVFQLPWMDFPEAPVPGLTPYEHLRPYLYSNHLRYSFGAPVGRPEGKWIASLNGKSIAELIPILKAKDFAAIYVNRRGYPDRGDAMIQALTAEGAGTRIDSPAGDLVCFILSSDR